jgi:hypothetical protein
MGRRSMLLVASALLAAASVGAGEWRTVVVRVVAQPARWDGPPGEAISGATVSVLCESEAVQMTDTEGYAVVARVGGGRCRVTVRLDGWCTWTGYLRADHDAVVLPVELAPFCIDVVTLQDRWSERFNLTVRARIGEGSWLPATHDPWSLLETLEPSAIVDRTNGPGLYLGEPGRFSMRGASWTQNSVTLDGVDITDPLRGGDPLAYPQADALETVTVTSALAPVENDVPGVTLALVPRATHPSWHTSAQGYWAPESLQADPAAGKAPPIARLGSLAEGSILTAGPVVREKLNLLFSGRASRLTRFEREQPAELNARVLSLFTQADYRAGAHDFFRLIASADAVRTPNPGRARYAGAEPRQDADLAGAQGRWQRDSDRLSWAAFAALRSGAFNVGAQGLPANRPIERLVDGPVNELVVPDRSRRTTWSSGGSLAFREQRLLGLHHAPRIGFTVAGAALRAASGPAGMTAELVDGLPARVWDYGYGNAESRRSKLDLSAFAADRFVLRDRVFVEAGLRLDRSTGCARGAAEGIAWTSLSPRVSARVRLTDFGRISVFGGYGEYRHRLLLDHLAFGDPAAAQGSVYRWLDDNENLLFEPSERGELIARVGPGSPDGQLATIDPGLKPPRTREFVVGLEGQIANAVTVRLTGFDRRERDLVESVNVGVPASGYRVRFIEDPSGDIAGPQDDQQLAIYDRRPSSFGLDRYVLTNPADHTGLHQSAEFRLETTRARPFQLQFGATAVRTEIRGGNRGFRLVENDQGIVGELFDSPIADLNSKGRAFFDRAFTVKLGASYRAPRLVETSAVLRYQDGQTFGRFVVLPGLSQGPELIPAIPRGQIERGWAKDSEGRYIVPSGHRFEFLLTLDARLALRLKWGERTLTLSGEAFNLLDLRHEVEEDIVWGERFREPTYTQPPRTLRLGARLDF